MDLYSSFLVSMSSLQWLWLWLSVTMFTVEKKIWKNRKSKNLKNRKFQNLDFFLEHFRFVEILKIFIFFRWLFFNRSKFLEADIDKFWHYLIRTTVLRGNWLDFITWNLKCVETYDLPKKCFAMAIVLSVTNRTGLTRTMNTSQTLRIQTISGLMIDTKQNHL